jgi:shikimate dehydrogenase
MKKFGVLGNPVTHSLSPKMFNAGFESQNFEGVYEFCDILPEEFNCFMKKVRTGEYAGLSVTVPYKEQVIEHCDELSDEAKKIGAVNCLYIKEGKLIGTNTDWFGFAESLKEVVEEVSSLKVLIFGAGGAAKACIYALNLEGVSPFVTNRTMSKVEGLAEDFDINVIEQDLLLDLEFDLIVNATSVGLTETDELIVPIELLAKASVVLDLIYLKTPLVEAAEEYGLKLIDAKRMLLLQGVLQYSIFTGVEAPKEIMWNSINQI